MEKTKFNNRFISKFCFELSKYVQGSKCGANRQGC